MLSSDWRLLLRRWYVLAAGILATAGLAALAMLAVPAKYQITANVVMLPPPSLNEQGDAANPYLNLGGLEGFTDVVARALTQPAVADQLEAAGLSTDYTVIRDPTAAGSILLITVDAKSPEIAIRTQQSLVDQAKIQTRQIQTTSSVRVGAFIATKALPLPIKAEADRSSQLRAVILAVAAGLGLTVLSASLVDGLLNSRRRQAGASGPPGPSLGNGSSPTNGAGRLLLGPQALPGSSPVAGPSAPNS